MQSSSSSSRQLPMITLDIQEVTEAIERQNSHGDRLRSISPLSVPNIGSDLIAPELSPWSSLENIYYPPDETMNSATTEIASLPDVYRPYYQEIYISRPSGFPEAEELNSRKSTESELEKYVNAPEFVPAQKSAIPKEHPSKQSEASSKLASPVNVSSPPQQVTSTTIGESRSELAVPAFMQVFPQPLFVAMNPYSYTPQITFRPQTPPSLCWAPSGAGTLAYPWHSSGRFVEASHGEAILRAAAVCNMTPVRMVKTVPTATPVCLLPQPNSAPQLFVGQPQVNYGPFYFDNSGFVVQPFAATQAK